VFDTTVRSDAASDGYKLIRTVGWVDVSGLKMMAASAGALLTGGLFVRLDARGSDVWLNIPTFVALVPRNITPMRPVNVKLII